MAKSFRFPRWVEKTRTYSIHPVAFIDQPVATPHQPRFAQQLPPGGSQGHFVPAGRQVGDPYKLRNFWRFPFNEQLSCVSCGRLMASPQWRGNAAGAHIKIPSRCGKPQKFNRLVTKLWMNFLFPGFFEFLSTGR